MCILCLSLGLKGEPGTDGTPGRQGRMGPSGRNGQDGRDGVNGRNGAKGQKGECLERDSVGAGMGQNLPHKVHENFQYKYPSSNTCLGKTYINVHSSERGPIPPY